MTSWYEGLLKKGITQADFKSEPNFELYDENNEKIPVTNVKELPTIITKNSRANVVVEPSFWSVQSTGFGITFKVLTVVVTRNTTYSKPTGNPFAARKKEITSTEVASTSSSPHVTAKLGKVAVASATPPTQATSSKKSTAPDSDEDAAVGDDDDEDEDDDEDNE
jgi:hypothetical protein